jgi:hypothetical protein
MPTIRHNWENYEKEWLNGTYTEVKDFLMTFLVLDEKTASNGYWKAKTKGWREKKQIYRLKITEESRKAVANDKDIAKSIAKLTTAKTNILNIISSYLQGLQTQTEGKAFKLDNQTMSGLRQAWEIIKIELGEPTKIDKLQGDKDNPLQTETTINLVLGKNNQLEE